NILRVLLGRQIRPRHKLSAVFGGPIHTHQRIASLFEMRTWICAANDRPVCVHSVQQGQSGDIRVVSVYWLRTWLFLWRRRCTVMHTMQRGQRTEKVESD